LRGGINLKLRRATLNEEPILKEWLSNDKDCYLVTNKNKYSTDLYNSWLLAEDQHCYFLIDENNKLVGYGELWIDEVEEDIELAHIVIKPTLRGNGFGKTLIQLLEEKAKAFPFQWIFMRVNPINERAIHCYKRLFYEEDIQLQETLGNQWVWLKKENK
jgi:ribosomal protein S18 acetylase RimI-like enzyme